MKYYLLLAIIAVTAICANAQEPSKDGNFEVDFNEGCVPLTIGITSLVPCNCNIFFDSGNNVDHVINNPDLTYTHTYTEPGTYELGLTAEGLSRDVITITVHPDTPPAFMVSKCSNEQIIVEITDNNYDSFTIDYDDGTAIEIGIVGSNQHTYALTDTYGIEVKGYYNGTGANFSNCDVGESSVEAVAVLTDAIITNLELESESEATLAYDLSPNTRYDLEIQINGDNTNNFTKFIEDISGTEFNISNPAIDFEENYYCFRIVTIDPCNNSKTYSNTLCSVDLDDIIVNDLSNQININAPANSMASPYNIQLWDIVDQEFKNRQTLTISSIFDDNQVACNVEYCYRIEFVEGGGASTSLTKCATALSLQIPSAIVDISIDASDNAVLSWSEPEDFIAETYQIFSSGTVISTSSINNYTHDINTSSSPVCYEIDYIDECGNTSELSTTICSIFLSSTTSNNITSLKWSSYIGWANGVSSYQVIKNGDIDNLVYTGLDFSYTPSSVQDEQLTLYQVIALPNDASLATAKSNIMSITNRSNITFPNAFVANGKNSEFKVVGRYIIDFDLKIYTRWGELIAHITDHNEGWDGTSNGRLLPEGNYIYAAEIKDEANNTHKRSGTVLLIRK